ncbi:helix-turn-helix transcriptional regulator [Streptomyces sp. NBC_00063]|uniref:helix-turn-helix transcriptional regulator n=1 Tax=Streptomyces sp. NBC_00063 TaxID=2975638 RepID=UPI003D713AC8
MVHDEDDEELVNARWQALGVRPFDQEVYLEALRHPQMGVAGWAVGLCAPVTRVRRAADRLLELGLLHRTARQRSRLAPVDPQLAVRAVVRRRQEEVDRLVEAAGSLSEQLADTYEHGRLRARPERILEVVEGADETSAQIGELLADADAEVCVIDAPPYVSPNEHGRAVDDGLRARGIRSRVLYDAQGLDHAGKFPRAMAAVAAGEQVRVVASAPLKLLLVDGRVALLPLTGSESGQRHRSVVVHGSTLTDALQELFEVVWRQAAPLRGRGQLPDGRLAREEGLTAAEQELVELLGSGLTDEVIARHLGVSDRTLRRRVRELQDRLGSTGRFQAGVRAAQRGWL